MLDLAILALAMPLALLLRENLVFDTDKFYNHIPFVLATLLVAVPVLSLAGVDRTVGRYASADEAVRIALAMTLVVLTATLATFAYNRLDSVSRSVPVLQALLAIIGMVGLRMALRPRYGMQPSPRPFQPVQSHHRQCVLVVGLNALSELYARALSEYGGDRARVAAIIDYDEPTDGMRLQGLPVFGSGRTIQDVINELAVHGVFIDRVVITIPIDRLRREGRLDVESFMLSSRIPVEPLVDRITVDSWRLAAPADRLHATIDPAHPVAFRFSTEELATLAAQPYWRLKRALDLVAALVLILLLWPVAIVVAVVVAIDVGMPVLFWQVRPGVAGRPFALFKFRTMRAARDREGNLRSETERLSRIGRFLRRTRLDELPQLWNILVGEMSFVGPRPLLPVDQSPAFAARLLVRPGLTGWGQIMGGRDIPAIDKAALDIWYVRNASLTLDLAIVRGTFPMVLRGERVDRKAIDRAWLELRRSGICRDRQAA
jgi:lipopolysaccharide/colanic/teichoic acid biosynthesis glycosyltransferase